MSTLKLTNASFSYSKKSRIIFKNVSFEVHSGEILAVLGPNGSGKTTLLKCFINLLKLSGGESTLDGKDIRLLSARDLFRRVAYVPQVKNMPTSYTVLETVLMGLSSSVGLFEAPKEKDIAKAEETLKLLGISELSERRCNTLSGGELQMVLIARAIVSDPKFLVLDEPESGLDFKNQLIVLETIRKLSAGGMACIFNTHYPDHALNFADHALLISSGQAVFGTSESVVTEENIKNAFGVESYIGTFTYENSAVKSVVPIKLSNDKEK